MQVDEFENHLTDQESQQPDDNDLHPQGSTIGVDNPVPLAAFGR